MSQVRVTALLDPDLHERIQALRIRGKRILSFGEALREVLAEGLPLAERRAAPSSSRDAVATPAPEAA